MSPRNGPEAFPSSQDAPPEMDARTDKTRRTTKERGEGSARWRAEESRDRANDVQQLSDTERKINNSGETFPNYRAAVNAFLRGNESAVPMVAKFLQGLDRKINGNRKDRDTLINQKEPIVEKLAQQMGSLLSTEGPASPAVDAIREQLHTILRTVDGIDRAAGTVLFTTANEKLGSPEYRLTTDPQLSFLHVEPLPERGVHAEKKVPRLSERGRFSERNLRDLQLAIKQASLTDEDLMLIDSAVLGKMPDDSQMRPLREKLQRSLSHEQGWPLDAITEAAEAVKNKVPTETTVPSDSQRS